MNAGIESTFANHSLIKQLLEPFRLLSRHTPGAFEIEGHFSVPPRFQWKANRGYGRP